MTIKEQRKKSNSSIKYKTLLRRLELGRPLQEALNTKHTGHGGSIYRGRYQGTKIHYKKTTTR